MILIVCDYNKKMLAYAHIYLSTQSYTLYTIKNVRCGRRSRRLLPPRYGPIDPGAGQDLPLDPELLYPGTDELHPLGELVHHQLLQLLYLHIFALAHTRTGGVVAYPEQDIPLGRGVLGNHEWKETACHRPQRIYLAFALIVEDAGTVLLGLHHRQIQYHLRPRILDPDAPLILLVEGVRELSRVHTGLPVDPIDILLREIDEVALLPELRHPLPGDQVAELLRSAMMTAGTTPLAPERSCLERGFYLHFEQQKSYPKKKRRKKKEGSDQPVDRMVGVQDVQAEFPGALRTHYVDHGRGREDQGRVLCGTI